LKKKQTLWQEGEERRVENRIVLRYHYELLLGGKCIRLGFLLLDAWSYFGLVETGDQVRFGYIGTFALSC